MDTKNFRDNLATRLGRRPADVDVLIAALGHIVGHSCAELDSVAVPTFGTFVPVKEQEQTVTDHTTGGKVLLPPQIRIDFRPGAMLLKRLRHE